MEENKYETLETNVTPEEEVMEAEPVEENVVVNENVIVDETGIIAKDTRVTGDIETKGHLLIHGEVLGNISANGNIVVTGKIAGDIACKSIKFSDCRAKTNVTAQEDVSIEQDTRVEGKITCKKITVDGMLKGDIEAEEVSIFSTAKVLGNIIAKSLSMEPGAELQGSVRVVR